MQTDETIIAVLQEQVKNLNEKFGEFKKQQEKISSDTLDCIKDLADKIETMDGSLNKGKGMFTAALMFIGAIGACIGYVITYFSMK